MCRKYMKNICLDSARCFTVPQLAWQVALKKPKAILYLLTDNDMLLRVEKVSEEEYVTVFIDMQKLITNSLKIMIKVKNDHILNTRI